MKLTDWLLGRRSTQLVASTAGGGDLVEKTLNPVYSLNTWFGSVLESFSGAFQQNVVLSRNENLAYFAVYSCISLIAQDISKMRPKLMRKENGADIWTETTSNAFSPVLRKPNHYQTRIKFLENWITSKLICGNTYILKEFDNRGGREAGVVRKMYVLDPLRVTPLVSEGGDVFYELKTDWLAGITEEVVTVPASEIIHDTGVCLFHPLVGVSPLFACGLAATQGIKIQTNGTKLFANMSRPSGMLVAPGAISNETATRLKETWEANYGGNNVGKTAVLGDGLKYEPLTITPDDAQMIEQLKMSAEVVCSTFHVPPYKVGIGAQPTYSNAEPLNTEYYSQALQAPIESIELLLDEGLGLVEAGYGVELDLDNLLRMDSATRYNTYTIAVGGGWMKPNEARAKEGMQPVKGGDTPYLQQQNYSLAALNKRDTSEDPFGTKPPPAPPTPPTDTGDEGSPDGKPDDGSPPPAPPPKAADPVFFDEQIFTALLRDGLRDEPELLVGETAPEQFNFTINLPEQKAGDVTVNVPEQKSPVVNVAPTEVTVNTPEQITNITNAVEAPYISVHQPKQPDVNVTNKFTVPQPTINVDPTPITMTVHPQAAPDVTVINEVQPTPVQVDVDVKAPVINVPEQPAPIVNVEAGDVRVNLPAPVVNAINEIHTHTEAPIINVPELKAPDVKVEVAAPSVTVVNEGSDYEIVESEVVRDDKGRAKGMKTTKRRKRKENPDGAR